MTEQATPSADRGLSSADEERLESWKEIASYLKRDVRTVQRWEKREGMPVHRHQHEKLGSIYAYKWELNAWWHGHLAGSDAIDLEDPASNLAHTTLPRRPHWVWTAVVLCLCGLLMVVGDNTIGGWLNGSKPPPGKITLAVRPFKSLNSSDPPFVAAGLIEELLARLGQRHPEEMVVVRLLTPDYAAAPIERLGREIKADYVLEGTVRQIGERVVITAQLIQVSSQSVVWGGSYDRSYEVDVKDLLRVQEEVADAIIGEVLNKLPRSSPPVREVNRQAYLAYLEGRYFRAKHTTESITRALTLFQESVTIDPTYAPSYAGLADCYEILGSAPYTALPPTQAFPKAEAAARKALELDDTLAEAHVSLGYTEMVYEWNLAEAQKELLRALQLRPDDATAHSFYAYFLTAVGNLDAAIAERKRALELDPVNPVRISALGEAFYQDRQFDRSIEQDSRSLELDPSYAVASVNIGRAYELKGMHAQARQPMERWRKRTRGYVLLFFEWDWPGAEKEIRQAIEISPNSSDVHLGLAGWFVVMGRYDDMVNEAQIAVQLDPLSVNAIFRLGAGFYECRRYAEAEEQFQKALELHPAFVFAAYVLALLYSAQGRHQEALSLLASAADTPITRAYMALAHVRAGDREKALEIVHEAERHPRQDYAALVLSVVHGLLGEEDEAITILERLFEERLPALVYLNGRTYAPLHGSPRFQDLTGRIGLPQPLRQI